MKIDQFTTLADAVDACPSLAREFERRGLDYCCGGQRTLAAACDEAGLDPALTVPITSHANANAQVRPHSLSSYDRLAAEKGGTDGEG